MTNNPHRKEDHEDEADVGVVTRTKPKTKKPSMYKVLLLNDDYTPMDFVVWCLVTIFRKDEATAARIMLDVHKKGQGIAGVYRYEIAETKAQDTVHAAKQNNFPLLASVEEVSD